jgi:hypothetical protein
MYQHDMQKFNNNWSLILNEKKYLYSFQIFFFIKLRINDKKKDMIFYRKEIILIRKLELLFFIIIYIFNIHLCLNF